MRSLSAVVSVILAGLMLSGCGDPRATGGAEGHSHDSAHGGVAVELGEHQYHLDFLADPGAGKLQVWIMDAHVENFVRVPLPSIDVSIRTGTFTNVLTLTPEASTATGETVGNTSHFSGQADWFVGVERFVGIVPEIEIRGQRFTGVSFQYPSPRSR